MAAGEIQEETTMHYKEFIVESTRNSCAALIRAARTLPEDKLNSKPSPDTRSALDQLQEVAQSANWYSAILNARSSPGFDADTLNGFRDGAGPRTRSPGAKR
jgi:hypothetical protein